MKLHLFHFSPHGLARAFSQLVAGRRHCRRTNMSLRGLIPSSVNSMTAAYNVGRTLDHAQLPVPATFLDVGANVSQMMKLLLGLSPDARVLSFEPNTALTPLGDVHRLALSDEDGVADFFLPDNDDAWGTIESGKGGAPASEVRMARMETLVAGGEIDWEDLQRPLFVKVDTEGSELRALKGFGSLLSEVDYLLVEVENAAERGENYNLLSLSEHLSEHGFDQSRVVYACYDGPDAPAYSDILFWKSSLNS